MVVWTDEMRAKALATRAHNKRKKQERMEKRMAKQAEIVAEDSNIGQAVHLSEVGTWPDGEPITKAPPDEIFSTVVSVPQLPEPFDWEKAPLIECITKQAELKREFDRITQILERRQNPTGMKWMCFTEEIRREKGVHVIPKPVLAACQRFGDDGKWKFRDDGRFVMVDGLRKLKPAFACSSACFSYYQMSKGQLR